jgi:hypothetical protein
VRKATRSIAAVLDLAAIGVEDAVIKIHRAGARRFDEQYLITAHTEAPIGEHAHLSHTERNRSGRGIDDDKVVAQSVHFGKFKMHFSSTGHD